MKITAGEESKFAKDFIEQYAKAGFGSMNKNDFEVLVLHLLRTHGNLKDLSFHKISLLLKVPEPKVRKLSHEADLKYGNTDEHTMTLAFAEVLKKVKFNKSNESISFSVSDKTLRNFLQAQLEEDGEFADTSFNTSIVKMSMDTFAHLIDKLYFKNAFTKDLIKQAEKQLQKPGLKAKDIAEDIIKGLGRSASGKVFDASLLALQAAGATPANLIEVVKGLL